ncbi:MAG: hypothetical protein GY720_00035, partial [bacterium]|nr:hypothetical protein [bacterium]
DVFPQFGGLEINTSSTALQALTDAVLYVSKYRYQSSDALASRILTVAALRDVLDAFDADGLPSAAVLTAAVADDLEALQALQNDDGGFPYWRLWRESVPFNTVHVVHALTEAKSAGYDVDQGVLANGLQYLTDIESHYPGNYSQRVRDTISAYALHVRMQAGHTDSAKATQLYRQADNLGLDAIAWLWPVIDDTAIGSEILRLLTNRATETAGSATFTTSYGDDAYLLFHSDRRTDGIILDALVAEAPESDLIPKVVAGLLGNQVRGRWSNISENAFILLA